MTLASTIFLNPTEPVDLGAASGSAAVVALPDGSYLIVHTRWNTPGGSDNRLAHSSNTTAQQYDANGTPLGEAFELFSSDGGLLGVDFESRTLPDGRVFVNLTTVMSGGGGTATLHVRELGSDGAPVADPVQLSGAPIERYSHFSTEVLADGRILVVGQVGNALVTQLVGTDGLPAGSATEIVPSVGFGGLVATQTAPDGRVLVIWREQNYESSPFSVEDPIVQFRATFLNPADGSTSPAFVLRAPDPLFQGGDGLISIEHLEISDTGVLAIWSQFEYDVFQNRSNVTFERFDLDGTPLGETRVLGPVTGTELTVAPMGQGLYLFGWARTGVYPEPNTGIDLKIFDANGQGFLSQISPFTSEIEDGYVRGPVVARVGDRIVVLGNVDGNTQMRLLDAREPVSGTAGDDTLNLTEAGYLLGLDGNDLLIGSDQADVLDSGPGQDEMRGGAGDDLLIARGGNNTIDGGAGDNVLFLDPIATPLVFGETALLDPDGTLRLHHGGMAETIRNIQNLKIGEGFEGSLNSHLMEWSRDSEHDFLLGWAEGETLSGNQGNDRIEGRGGNDTLFGGIGDDQLFGGEGFDELHGGDGDDYIHGSDPASDPTSDLRDVVYAGSGNDTVHGGYGNDLIYGMDGDDVIAGGFGVDELIGQDGNDVITGSAYSDLIFGNAGDDFVNGGFGHDRINGGTGADKFFHIGVAGHGSDWVQDYNSAEGDVLLFGNTSATRADFQVNFAHTQNAEGERAGDDGVQEAFVIYRPTGQIMWALVDGTGQSAINLQIGADVYDLLA